MSIITYCTKLCEQACCTIPPCAYVFGWYYQSVIEREIALCQMNVHDRVLCIGGGATPFSACLFAAKTGAHVTVIDKESSVISQATKFVKLMHLEDHVTVLHQNGLEVCPTHFSVIHIAMQVTPLDRIKDYLYNSMANTTRLIIRQPKTRIKGHYSVLEESEYAKATAAVAHSGKMIAASILFVKQLQNEHLA
ncbi:class I SAM-dependent methyltransferase [Salipaludibacillus agaradhaerens]|uniref:class I SAM-dependent methyltransferase n=1 Tax=Salipaludibacillus agaradhaerens TaxID=76935 RepID=UPI002150A31C|nr:class I SAM-dependent methyltransferase [Salipaludibacillus agaradhaerens]MCR6108368.1 class I SAM-dependent methyltransferase [Salipaludibacillus agaradhaerens]MCR6120391.1 class I SAM-dependent methyltransferase [Salipaludibacillus agaradhaerens]